MKFLKLLLIATLLLSGSKTYSQDPNFHIYLCFGQSNMVGSGPVESQDRSGNDRFRLFQALDCSNLGRIKERWYKAVPPTCNCYSGLSPADYFGRTLIANLPDSITIGIINVAIGGCDIRLFDKDIYQNYDSTITADWFQSIIKLYGGNPYEYLINLSKQAKQDGVIRGILLHQGETNTGDRNWPSYVKKIYNDMLTDLSLDPDSVPLLAGELVNVTEGGCCSAMNPIINKLPLSIPTAHVISSKDCPVQPDKAHFTSEGYRMLGRRYAVKMLSLMGYEAFYAEAECNSTGINYVVKEDSYASNNGYVTSRAGTVINSSEVPPAHANVMQITVSVNKDTTWHLYGRFKHSAIRSNSFWFKIDDNQYELITGTVIPAWRWLKIKSSKLTAGEHIISIAFAETGASLDKLVLKNSEITPAGIGEEAEDVCAPDYSTAANDLILHGGYALEQNYPNPASGETTFSIELPYSTHVSLKIYNLQGVELAELAAQELMAGKHILTYNLDHLPSGNYYYIMKTNDFFITRKMVIR